MKLLFALAAQGQQVLTGPMNLMELIREDHPA
jgi:hypothetical protein